MNALQFWFWIHFLLLPFSFANVKGYLQKHLTGVEQSNILANADKTELYCLYINCLEVGIFFYEITFTICVPLSDFLVC